MTANDRAYLSACIRRCATELYAERGRFWGPSIQMWDEWRRSKGIPQASTIIRAWLGTGWGEIRRDDRTAWVAGWASVLADLGLTVPSQALRKWATTRNLIPMRGDVPVEPGWLTNGERAQEWHIHHGRWERGMEAIGRPRELRRWAPVKRSKCGRPVFGWLRIGTIEMLELR